MTRAQTGSMIGCIVEDRYLVEAELGNGAMGRVYAARHIRVGRRVAIKVMHDELAQNAMIVERFAREGLVAARLRHPNLVSVLDVGKTADGRPLLVLELAPGRPLSEMPGALEANRVMSLVRQLLLGLEHAHAAGLIHRDLKPDNILVETTADGTEIPRIVDFGIAVDTGSSRRLTEANIVIGTPFYMSPEQARAKKIDQRSDLFSLGVIMYELLAGMPPFPGSSVEAALANATREPPSIFERAGIAVDPLLETFARRLMARHLEERFASASEALQVLALIERDRLAAARALATIGHAAAVVEDVAAPAVVEDVAAPTVVETDANTDGLSTVVDVRVGPDIVFASTEPDTVFTSNDGDIDDLRETAAARTRRSKRFGFAVAAAALVMFAAVGLAARGEQVAPPHAGLDATETVGARERVTINETVVDAPRMVLAAKREKADPRIVELIAMTKAATPATKTMTTTRSAVAISSVASALPVAVQPAVVDMKLRDSADSVVAKYVAVGRALKSARNDDAWARFRLIRINEALATATGRHDALVALASIEKQIQ